MPLVVRDRVRETTTTTGTGTVTLAGAVSGFQSFSVIGNGNTTYYTITLGTDWEVGIGTYTASGTTLSRDTILESSNSGSAVNFGAGTKDVFVTYPAERAVFSDGVVTSVGGTGTVNGITLTGSVTSTGSLTLGGTLSGVNLTSQVTGTLPVANGGTGTATALTAGSVVFAGASGVYSQDNANLFWDDTNKRLGIGTTSPARRLDVQGAGTNIMRSRSTDTSGGTVGIVSAEHASGSSLQVRAGVGFTNLISTGAADPLIFSTAGTERARIDSAGNVGIGTASPGQRLDVSGNINASGSLTLGTALSVANGGTGATTLTGVVIGNGTSAFTVKTNPTGAFVGTTDTQTLSGKTIERAILNDGYTEEVFAISDGGTVNLDPNNGSIQTWTLGANRTPDQANWAAGQSITLMVDDGTARTITWTTLAVVWETDGGNAPTLALTGFTVIVLWKVGTTIYGARVGNA